MKYVQVLKEIQVTVNGEPCKNSDGTVELPWSFGTYLVNIVLPDPSIGTAYKVLKSCAILEAQFKDVSVGKWIAVEDAHWELIKIAIETPKGSGVPSSVLRQLLPFMDAVLEAKNEKPEDLEM